MRQLTRPDIRLPTLARIDKRHGERWKRTGSGGPSSGRWNNPDVRGALIAMHGRACAYCQGSLPEGARGEVDHFRPQSLYAWLAYAFDNYLLSCGRCNGELKFGKFPLHLDGPPYSYGDRTALANEPRLLLDPATDPAEAWIAYDFSSDIAPMTATSGLPERTTAMVEATIALFQLAEGRPLLARDRYHVVQRISDLVEAIEAGQVHKLPDLQFLANRYRAHGAVARHLLVGLRPDLLPTPEDELSSWVRELCDDLGWVQRNRPRDPDRAAVWRRDQQELRYALATLWVAPPILDAEWIEARLIQHGVRDEILPYRQKLQRTPTAGNAFDAAGKPAIG